MSVDRLRLEIIRRELARRDFRTFVQFVMGATYQECEFTKKLCAIVQQFVEDIEAGLGPQLILTCPPRHGKTQHVTRMLPAWFLGRNPTKEFISVTHSQTVADLNGGDVREVLNSAPYKDLFNVNVDRSFNAKEFVKLVGGKNSFTSTSIEAGLPGRGADILCIDDFHKNTEDADSRTIRDKIRGWWSGTASNRIMAGGGVLITATRWHVDDLIGTLLNSDQSHNWTVHEFPAVIDEANKIPLHPVLVPWDTLMQRKSNASPRHWAALYLCKPYIETGAFFTIDILKYYDDQAPGVTALFKKLNWMLSADYATSTKTSADRTCVVAAGVSHERDIYIHPDIIYGQLYPHTAVKRTVAYGKTMRTYVLAHEKGVIANTLEPLFQIESAAQSHYFATEHYSRTNGKHEVANAIKGLMQAGKVYLPKSKRALIEPLLLRFMPDSDGEDDLIDALAGVGITMNKLVRPPPPELPSLSTTENQLQFNSRMFREKLEEQKREREGITDDQDEW